MIQSASLVSKMSMGGSHVGFEERGRPSWKNRLWSLSARSRSSRALSHPCVWIVMRHGCQFPGGGSGPHPPLDGGRAGDRRPSSVPTFRDGDRRTRHPGWIPPRPGSRSIPTQPGTRIHRRGDRPVPGRLPIQPVAATDPSRDDYRSNPTRRPTQPWTRIGPTRRGDRPVTRSRTAAGDTACGLRIPERWMAKKRGRRDMGHRRPPGQLWAF